MSVHRVPSVILWIHMTVTGVCPAGFPHSDICGSWLICSSPQLFAACRVFHRLLVPRHPPCALSCLTIRFLPWEGYLQPRIAFHGMASVLFLSFLYNSHCTASDVSIFRIFIKIFKIRFISIQYSVFKVRFFIPVLYPAFLLKRLWA